MPELVQIVDTALADAVRRSGSHLVCRPGCAQCCVGVFAISQQDAARLRHGLDQLDRIDPARAERVRARAAASVLRVRDHFPGDPVTGLLAADVEFAPEFEDFANDEVCPALDPATRTCDLYEARPILCRTFGPPLRTEDGNLAACELCFTTASTEVVASCELDPCVAQMEQESNLAFNAANDVKGETVVAYALFFLQPCNLEGSS